MQVARVAVSEEQWRAFRTLALARDVSVSGYLGRLVTNELDRQKPAPVKADDTEASDVSQALEALRSVRASIDELDGIAGRLARSATSRGAFFGRRWRLRCNCRPREHEAPSSAIMRAHD
jgi:hypothetical protein